MSRFQAVLEAVSNQFTRVCMYIASGEALSVGDAESVLALPHAF